MDRRVGHSEREWILIGIAECCASQGFEETTTEDVCAAAGVSRESFDQLFADKDECLGAAMEAFVEEAWRELDHVAAPGKLWSALLRDGTSALLQFASARPALAHMALIEAPVASGRAGALHDSAKAALLDFLEQGRDTAEPGIPPSAARGALSGAEALVTAEVLAGKGDRLSEELPSIVYMLAVPFLGIGEAGRLANGAARRGHLRAVA